MAGKPVATSQLTIARPIEEVWELIGSNFGDFAAYSDAVRNSWTVGSQTTGVGAKRRSELRTSSGFVEEVVGAWEPPNMLETTITNTSQRFQGAIIRLELEGNGNSTNLRCLGYLPTRFPWKKLLAKGSLSMWVRGLTADIKKTLESGR